MSYYFFNNCRKDGLSEIEKLANELGLKRTQSDSVIEWEGYPLKRKKKFYRSLLMIYDPQSSYLFKLQTSSSVSHKQKDVKTILQRLIKICRPTQINDVFSTYDMEEFH